MDRTEAFFTARHVLNTSRSDDELEAHLIASHDIVGFGTSRRNMDLLHIELTLAGQVGSTHHVFKNTEHVEWMVL